LENLYDIGVSQYGTRVVQKMIEKLKTKDDITLLKKHLEPQLGYFLKDNNAYHIIVKCLSTFEEASSLYIYKYLKKNIVNLSLNKHGCCAIQKCLESAVPNQQELIIQKIIKSTLKLISDAQGNYVVSYVVCLKNSKYIKEIVSKIISEGNFKVLCKQRFSSTVLEKCFDYCAPDVRSQMIDQICINKSSFKEILCDNYGSFCKS
jgi:pumilio RNA-binding family